MPDHIDKVEAIARGLTEAQRRALIQHPWQGYYGWPQSAHDPLSFNKSGRALMDMGLIQWHPDKR